MTTWVTLRMTVRNGAYKELSVLLENKLPAVRGFPGALSVSALFDNETGRLLVTEEWKSREHHQAYIAAISESGVMAQLISYMTGPPDVQYYKRVVL